MTSPTPIGDIAEAASHASGTGAHAAPAPPQLDDATRAALIKMGWKPPAPRRTFAVEAHHLMATAWQDFGHFLPFLEQAATDPEKAEAIELIMRLIPGGGQLEPVLVLLRHLAQQAQPLPLPAPASGDGAL